MSATVSGGQLSITIKGIIEPFGVGVHLERSTDMQHWSGVMVGDSDPDNGEFSFTFTVPVGTLTQFYQVVDLLEPN